MQHSPLAPSARLTWSVPSTGDARAHSALSCCARRCLRPLRCPCVGLVSSRSSHRSPSTRRRAGASHMTVAGVAVVARSSRSPAASSGVSLVVLLACHPSWRLGCSWVARLRHADVAARVFHRAYSQYDPFQEPRTAARRCAPLHPRLLTRRGMVPSNTARRPDGRLTHQED